MRFIISRLSSLVIFVCVLNLGSAFATPESSSTPISLLISPSVRVNGMGNAGVALTDEPSGYYNPAALAVSAKNGNATITTYSEKMDWLPALADNATYSYTACSFGIERSLGERMRGSVVMPFTASGAIGYYRTALKFNDTVWGYDGTASGYLTDEELANAFVFGGSARFIAEIGAGVTVKRAHSDLADTTDTIKADATAFDAGLLGTLPLVDFAEYLRGEKLEWYGLRPELDISAGVVWNNLGRKITWSDGSHDPLPRNFTHGYAGTAGFSYDDESFSLNLFRYTAVRETYVPRIDGESYADVCNDKKRGWEVSFLETYTIRGGKYDDEDGDRHYETEGYTISSDGMFKLMAGYWGKYGRVDYVLSHTTVNWSRFEYSGGVFEGIKNSQLSILFRM